MKILVSLQVSTRLLTSIHMSAVGDAADITPVVQLLLYMSQHLAVDTGNFMCDSLAAVLNHMGEKKGEGGAEHMTFDITP